MVFFSHVKINQQVIFILNLNQCAQDLILKLYKPNICFDLINKILIRVNEIRSLDYSPRR